MSNETLTSEEYVALMAAEEAKKRRNKYGAKPVRDPEYGYFASTGEHQRWYALLALQQGGFIRNLRRQVPYDCIVGGVKVTRYVADFVYEERLPDSPGCEDCWLPVTEDFKGKRTAEYRIKRALMRACFGIELKETGR